MKTPRKFYLVVSKKNKRDVSITRDGCLSFKDAKVKKKRRNAATHEGCADWTIEKFVKGD